MKKLWVFLSILFLSVVIGGSASATLVTVNGPAAYNVDTVSPTLVTLFSPNTGTIFDLDLFLDLDAACCGYDDTVILSHLDTGTSVTIWFDSTNSGNQSFGDVRNATFDDEALTAFVNAPYGSNSFDILPGTYSPAGMLSAFDGENIFGNWQLSIQNTGCCPNEGDDLLAWSITADIMNPIPEPTTMLLLSIGLMGIAGRVRRKNRRP